MLGFITFYELKHGTLYKEYLTNLSKTLRKPPTLYRENNKRTKMNISKTALFLLTALSAVDGSNALLTNPIGTQGKR